ncbi:hypothetical protein MN116_004341 [Schistosoma mekongi]|uniref:Uncharacterized protein n=1 Tax=Schistosoma mekongi TaxID=38744 RepID=A0AAE1ZG00_SCHME|nr:hypothetical protein MN116_004341 [Schistosoma mekongi]
MGVHYSLNKNNDCIHNLIIKGKILSNIHINNHKHFKSQKYSYKTNNYIIKVINIRTNNKIIVNSMNTNSKMKSIDNSQVIFHPSMNSRECISPTLPRRKSPTHTKIFNSCVPLSGLRRSSSLPKQNNLFGKHISSDSKIGVSRTKCLSRNNSKCFTAKENTSPIGTEFSCSSGSCSKDLLLKWKNGKHSQTSRDKSDKEFDYGQDNLVFENCVDYNNDDQATNTTFLSSENTPSIDDCSSIFCDPILAKLEAELPVPPPPPRACPPWLKAALAKQDTSGKETVQKLNFQDRGCVSSSLQLPTTQLSPLPTDLDQHKACSLGNSRFNVRIYPIIQNGVKISDTHYWLLDPPRSRTLRDKSTLTRRVTEYVHNPPSSPLGISPTVDGYTNIESTSLCPANELPLKDVKLRRGKSENCKDSLKNFYRELVLRLMKEVPQATESECQAVLIGSSYDYEEATRRLKFELLCRKDYVSRSHSKRLLSKCNWDLDTAISRARYEYELRKLRRQEKEQMLLNEETQSSCVNQIRGRSKYLIPHSSTSSDSSLSPLPCPIHQHQPVISPWYDEARRSNLF